MASGSDSDGLDEDRDHAGMQTGPEQVSTPIRAGDGHLDRTSCSTDAAGRKKRATRNTAREEATSMVHNTLRGMRMKVLLNTFDSWWVSVQVFHENQGHVLRTTRGGRADYHADEMTTHNNNRDEREADYNNDQEAWVDEPTLGVRHQAGHGPQTGRHARAEDIDVRQKVRQEPRIQAPQRRRGRDANANADARYARDDDAEADDARQEGRGALRRHNAIGATQTPTEARTIVPTPATTRDRRDDRSRGLRRRKDNEEATPTPTPGTHGTRRHNDNDDATPTPTPGTGGTTMPTTTTARDRRSALRRHNNNDATPTPTEARTVVPTPATHGATTTPATPPAPATEA